MIIRLEQVFDTLNSGLPSSRTDSGVERITQTEQSRERAEEAEPKSSSSKRVYFSRFHVIEPRSFNILD